MKTRPPLLRSALDANAAAANKEESSSQQQEDNVDLKPILPSDSKGLANESKKQGATIAASTTIPVMDDCAATHAAAAAASDLTNHWADQAAVDAAVAAAESFGQAQAAFLAEAIAMEDTAAENTNCSKKEETKKDKDLEPEVMDSAESTTAV